MTLAGVHSCQSYLNEEEGEKKKKTVFIGWHKVILLFKVPTNERLKTRKSQVYCPGSLIMRKRLLLLADFPIGFLGKEP